VASEGMLSRTNELFDRFSGFSGQIRLFLLMFLEKNKMDISVIVPLFYGEEYLPGLFKMLEANAKAARDLSIELILVKDDDKPPVSLLGCNSFSVQYLTDRAHTGIQLARIEGIQHAKGKYILLLDQDDEISDRALVTLFTKANGADAIISRWIDELDDTGRNVIKRSYMPDTDFLTILLLGGNYIGPPGHCLIKRKIVLECWEGMILNTDGADDYLLWLSFLLKGYRFAVCDDYLYTHKFNKNSFSFHCEEMIQSQKEVYSLITQHYSLPIWRKLCYRLFVDYKTKVEYLVQKKTPTVQRCLVHLRYFPLFLYRTICYKKWEVN